MRGRSSSKGSQTPQQAPSQVPDAGDQEQNELGNQALLEKLLASAGEPEDLPFKGELEGSLGTDLSGVDAYTGLGAGLRDLGVNAVALGGDAILFADTSPDKGLVAHEVAHVVQAGPGAAATGATTTAGDGSEQEANSAAAAVANGESYDVTGSTNGAVAGDTGGAIVGGIIGGLLGGPGGAVLGGIIGDALTTDPTPEEQMAEFRAQSYASLLDHSATSGGLFDVHFNAATDTLRINLKVGYNFISGDPTQVAPGFPAAEFDWTPEEEEAWRTQYQSEVSAQWSGQHEFSSTKPDWDMNIACTVEVTQDDADPHYILTVSKYPDDAEMVGSAITPKGANDHGTGRMDSNDMRPEQKLDWSNSTHPVQFGKGHTDLNGAAQTQVDTYATAISTIPGAHVQLEGRASSDHPSTMNATQGAEHNMGLARLRSTAVKTRLMAGGVLESAVLVRNAGIQGATDDEEWCRVDVQGGTQEMQSPALHETGHMFGLGDEYTNSSNPAGSAVRSTYDAILRDEMGLTITRSKSESAMGSGSTVQNWHYVTFLQSLKEITGTPDWTV